MNKFKKIEVYVSVIANRSAKNVFAYGFVAKCGNKIIKTGSSNYKNSTQNRVELFAACNVAYMFLNECDELVFYTHNNYVIQVLSNRNRRYEKNNDIISKFREITKDHYNISFIHRYINNVPEFSSSNQYALSSFKSSPKEDSGERESDASKQQPHSVEYHEVRLKALFATKGINLNKYSLSLFAQIYANPFWLTSFDDSIKYLSVLADIIKKDHEKGIIL